MKRVFSIAAALATLALPGAAWAQDGRCRPPLKDAAGACVAQCPAGYEDNGRFCTYRSLNR